MDEKEFRRRMQESFVYSKLNALSDTVYSEELYDAVKMRIPPTVIKDLESMGWNVFGIYEVVKEEMEKRAKS